MKKNLLTFLLLLAISTMAFAQKETPTSFYIIDPQSGAQVPATSNDAMLFKNSLIALVANTNAAKIQSTLRFGPGKKSIIITQADPRTNGTAYQLSLQRIFLGQTTIIYTFLYNADQNALYFFDPNTQNWVTEVVQGNNSINLSNCFTLSKFNSPPPPPPVQAQVTDVQNTTSENVPVDTSVYTTTVPPALPDYEQPPCPEDGYLWQPGYWAYSTDTNGYYWVPGVWVAPPSVGLLWTPPYWGFDGNRYVFYNGYWGNTIGFYGGINYGFGYGGVGFVGGDWYQGHFRYNTFVVRVGGRVHNTYVDNTVIINRNLSHTSFNGRGGIIARPSEREMAAMHERHVMATSEQIRNQRAARNDRTQFASSNNGRPGNLAAERPPVRNTNFNNGQRAGGNNPGNANPGGQRPGNPGGNNPGNPNQGGQRPGNPGGNNPGAPGQGTRPGGPGQAGPPQGGVRPSMPGQNPGGARPGTNGPVKTAPPVQKPKAPPAKTDPPKKGN